MNFGKILNDFGYAKDAIAGTRMQRWLPVIATILLCISLPGYTENVKR